MTSWRDPGELLDHLGIETPGEIDIEAIADFCGATILYEEMRGCAARVLGNNGRAIITVNKYPAYRELRRFRAAHELGHWILDPETTAFSCSEAMMEATAWHSHQEQRANRWAQELLMPAKMFAKDMDGNGITYKEAQRLGRRYRANAHSAALRMVQVGRRWSMIIYSRRGRRYKWFRRSPEMPSSLVPLPEPGPGSVAYKLMRGPVNPPGPTLVPWAEWVELEEPFPHYVIEDSVSIGVGEALTLLEWTDEVPAKDRFGRVRRMGV